MSLYSLIFRLIKNPFTFDTGGHLDFWETKVFRNIFEPYAKGKDRAGCMDLLHGTRIGMEKWPVLHLLAMIKINDNRYDPSMVNEMVAGVTDFLEHDWMRGNKLMRESSRFIDALHRRGHTVIEPWEFIIMVAKDMDRHLLRLQAIQQIFVPEDWADDAGDDPSNLHLAQALMKNADLTKELLTDLSETRFNAALVHYPVAALRVSLDRDARWDRLLGKDLGL